MMFHYLERCPPLNISNICKQNLHALALLLGHGLDPNFDGRGGYSIWHSWLINISNTEVSIFPGQSKVLLETLLLFLSYGADVSAFECEGVTSEGSLITSFKLKDRNHGVLKFSLKGLDIKDIQSAIQLIQRERDYQENRDLYSLTRKRKYDGDGKKAPMRFKRGIPA
jgi:hypothetical protein